MISQVRNSGAAYGNLFTSLMCSLVGSIPESIVQLVRLTAIDFQKTKINGERDCDGNTVLLVDNFVAGMGWEWLLEKGVQNNFRTIQECGIKLGGTVSSSFSLTEPLLIRRSCSAGHEKPARIQLPTHSDSVSMGAEVSDCHTRIAFIDAYFHHFANDVTSASAR